MHYLRALANPIPSRVSFSSNDLGAKRANALVRVFDAFSLVLVAAIVSFAFVEPAFAYVDPSVMTYTIQALAGVAVALGAVAGVALRRTRKWLFKVLKIDENVNKEVEPDVIRCDGAEFDTKQAALAEERTSNGNAEEHALTYKQRLKWAALASFFVVFTILFVAPVEIIAANSENFVFSLNDCWPPIALFDIALCIVLTCLVALLRGRAFRVAIAVMFVFGIGCYIQAFFLNGGLPVANGAALDFNEHKTSTIVSTIVWLVLIAGAVIAYRKLPHHTPRVLSALALALVLVQSIGVGSLLIDGNANKSAVNPDNLFITETGLYDLSPKNNVVVFVLDMFDIKNLDDVLVEDPHALDEFNDFTYYHNATAAVSPTRLGIPYLLTGVSLEGYDNYDEYLEDRFKKSNLIEDIHNAGYSIGIYTSDLWQGFDKYKDISINIGPLEQSAIDPWGVIAVAIKTSFYRDLPWLLKPLAWYSSDELNENMANRESFNESCTPYVIDDPFYYKKMKENPLELSDEGREGAFRFIHLQGAHYPFTMDAQGELSDHTDKIQQCRGALKIVSEYFQQMKDAGAYDNATIIVTADHGYWAGEQGIIREPEAPILLVHRPQKHGPSHGEGHGEGHGHNEGRPFTYSHVPTGHQDVAASLIASVGGDYHKYGHPIWDTPEGPRPRYYYTCMYNEKVWAVAQIEFIIDGDVNNFDDWTLTGKVYHYSDGHSEHRDLEKGQRYNPEEW